MRTYNTVNLIKNNVQKEIRNYPHTNSHHGGHFKDNHCLNEIDNDYYNDRHNHSNVGLKTHLHKHIAMRGSNGK